MGVYTGDAKLICVLTAGPVLSCQGAWIGTNDYVLSGLNTLGIINLQFYWRDDWDMSCCVKIWGLKKYTPGRGGDLGEELVFPALLVTCRACTAC